jgi:hypothetical protein
MNRVHARRVRVVRLLAAAPTWHLSVTFCPLCAALVPAEGERQHERWHLAQPAAPADPPKPESGRGHAPLAALAGIGPYGREQRFDFPLPTLSAGVAPFVGVDVASEPPAPVAGVPRTATAAHRPGAARHPVLHGRSPLRTAGGCSPPTPAARGAVS